MIDMRERCPDPSCLDGSRMYLGASGHYFGRCHESWHLDQIERDRERIMGEVMG